MIISKQLQNKLKNNGWDGELELDVLNHICVKYAKEFFDNSEGITLHIDNAPDKLLIATTEILQMLQQNKHQEEIEKYIWDNCKDNLTN